VAADKANEFTSHGFPLKTLCAIANAATRSIRSCSIALEMNSLQHRDKPHFDRVFGPSLGSACKLRFRKAAGVGALRPRCGAAINLHHEWRIAAGLGAQHSRGEGPAPLDHIPDHGR
jgi:hypothetical protein